MKLGFSCALGVAVAIALLDPGRAEACGGCFAPPTQFTVVTDHRMALSISPQQTVLWDQIRYSGDPADFAWVLPVRAGARLELSSDEWFAALDASTQPVVVPPPTFGGNFGCGLTGCASTTSTSAEAAPGAGEVQVLSQSVVGPYETVTLRATDTQALRAWLKDHDYAIPPAVEPVIDAYVAEGFDFIALRLRPDCGERSMQPVRVVTQGADPTLPLRMVAAGVGARVGLTLYVISEGRYRPQNFPSAEIDESALTWDRIQSRSNYDALTVDLMGRADGRTWVVEYADKPQVFTERDPRFPYRLPPGYVSTGRSTGFTPGLADAYFAQCKNATWRPELARRTPASSPGSSPSAPFTPCPRTTSDAGIGDDDAGGGHDGEHDAGTRVDAGDHQHDAGEHDAGEHDAGEHDAGDHDAGDHDAGDHDAGATEDPGSDAHPPNGSGGGACLTMDDLDVATGGLHPQDVWVTRLRASLPANALGAGDLRLEAAPEQTPVTNVHFTTAFADETRVSERDGCLSAPKRHTAFGSWALAAAAAIAGVAFARRRSRR